MSTSDSLVGKVVKHKDVKIVFRVLFANSVRPHAAQSYEARQIELDDATEKLSSTTTIYETEVDVITEDQLQQLNLEARKKREDAAIVHCNDSSNINY